MLDLKQLTCGLGVALVLAAACGNGNSGTDGNGDSGAGGADAAGGTQADTGGTSTGGAGTGGSTGTGGVPTGGTGAGGTSAPDGPVIISATSDRSVVREGESFTLTIVATDPDGIEDVIGGQVTSEDGSITFGALMTQATQGTYSFPFSWDQLNALSPITFGTDGQTIGFRIVIFDQAANEANETILLDFTCDGLSACGGTCTDIDTDPFHCGQCGHMCANVQMVNVDIVPLCPTGGCCQAGVCQPAWSECISVDDGITTCDDYCQSQGESCVQAGCQGDHTWLGWNDIGCAGHLISPSYRISEACNAPLPWEAQDLQDVRCCCTDTQ